MNNATITAGELAGLRRQGQTFSLIDVRTPAEFREMHAESAHLVPLDVLDPQAFMASRPKDEVGPVYTICRSGGRGREAAARFHEAGFPDVANVEGGTIAWKQVGLPVVRGRKTIALERQVRIVAGTLVVVGTTLGVFVHPAFLGLAAFVGAGLVFAGVTDTCGMGIILARMPWNRA